MIERRTTPERRSPDGYALLAATAWLVTTAGSVWHILRRTAPPTWDDAWYLEVSVRLWRALTTESLGAFAQMYSHAFGMKAPLITLIPFPFYAVLGAGMTSALLANQACLAVASVYVFKLAGQLHSKLAGLLAVSCLNTIPLIFGISRLVFVECLLVPIVCAWVYYLFKGGSWKALGVLFGLGMLAKVTFPLYVLAPTLALAFRGRRVTDWLKTAALGGVIAATWYAFNARTVLKFALSTSFGDIAKPYGEGGLGAISAYLRSITLELLSVYYTIALLILAALWLRRTDKRWWNAEALAILGWMVVPTVVFTASPDKMYRFEAPNLAGASLALGVLLAGLLTTTRRWRTVAALFFLVPAMTYVLQAMVGDVAIKRRGTHGLQARLTTEKHYGTTRDDHTRPSLVNNPAYISIPSQRF
jgi:4-amino-4-deoxy-L-arabinose transferase-like glycosyltransferase